MSKKHIFVCVQNRPLGDPRGSCQGKSSVPIYREFVAEFTKRSLWGSFRLTRTGCLGPCTNGPSVLVYPEGVLYGHVTPADVGNIIEQHLLAERPVERLTVRNW